MLRRFMTKSVGGAMVAALFVTTGVERANASDLGKVILGVGVGCMTGMLNCGNNRKPRYNNNGSRSGISSAQRQQNREVQTALNGFGWNVGSVDGSLGKRSKAAIRDYQGYMGYPRTGQLSEFERNNLLDSWRKYQAGAGSAYPRTMAAEGPRGLLNIGRDPNYASRYGDNATPNYGNGNNQNAFNNGNGQGGYNNGYNGQTGYNNNNDNQWNNGSQNAGLQQQQQPQVQAPQGGQVIGNSGGTIPALKPLKPIGQAPVSAAGRCELVDQTTRIQGGVIRASNMTDANQALSEKFCEARGFAITQGGTTASQYQISSNEMTGLCEQITTGFKPVMTSLPNSDQAQIMPNIQSTATQLGLTDAQTMSVYGQICLGIGYRLDNAEMALAGALTMMASGQAPYGELVGHHLREGFGVTQSSKAATQWYSNAMTALEQGATPVFVPSTTPERVQVIRTALQMQSQSANRMPLNQPNVVKVSNQLPVLVPNN